MTKELRTQRKFNLATCAEYFACGVASLMLMIVINAIFLFPFVAKSYNHNLFSLSNYI